MASPRGLLTSRAGRWATRQAGRGRPLTDIAGELGCGWHAVNVSVRRWGEALLEADADRVGAVRALGLDETLMWRKGRYRTKPWSANIVDVGSGQLLDVVCGRTAKAPARWLLAQPSSLARGHCLGGAGPVWPLPRRVRHRTPDARQVADPFHVVKLANTALDGVRRQVQNQTLGHRGHKDDPLYRARKLLICASERVSETGRTKLRGLLAAGDPRGEVRNAWHR